MLVDQSVRSCATQSSFAPVEGTSFSCEQAGPLGVLVKESSTGFPLISVSSTILERHGQTVAGKRIRAGQSLRRVPATEAVTSCLHDINFPVSPFSETLFLKRPVLPLREGPAAGHTDAHARPVRVCRAEYLLLKALQFIDRRQSFHILRPLQIWLWGIFSYCLTAVLGVNLP